MGLSLPSERYFRFLADRLELIKRGTSALSRLYEADLISRSVYEAVNRRVEAEITLIEERLGSLIYMAERSIGEFEEAIRLLLNIMGCGLSSDST